METEFLTREHSSTPSLVQMWDSSKPPCIIHVTMFLTGKRAERVWFRSCCCSGSACLLMENMQLRSHKFSLAHHPNLLYFPRKAVLSVSLTSRSSSSQPFVSFKEDSRCFPYLSTLVSASRLFMMPRAPTPPENPFWRELELDWRGCPMAISESCFCIIARFTCRKGKR